MILVSPEYGVIQLRQIDSENIPAPNLQGSETFYYQDQFGTITLQQYKNEFYSIRFAVFNVIKKITFLIKEDGFVLKSIFSLNNNCKIKESKSKKINLKKGQYIFCSAKNEELLVQFDKPDDYHIFEGSFSNKLLENIFEAFPSLKDYISGAPNTSIQKIESPSFVSQETKKIINDILSCPYDQNLRKLYFENKVNDLLFEILLQIPHKPVELKTQNWKLEAVYNTRNIILSDITKHYSIKELSSMVSLNQVELKTTFREAFGTGMFEFLMKARMEKAYQLVTETNKPIKEIASETGFQYIANFITSFHRHYGQTPGELRRK
jgi:AraC-like DNA-binding protein